MAAYLHPCHISWGIAVTECLMRTILYCAQKSKLSKTELLQLIFQLNFLLAMLQSAFKGISSVG